MEGIEQVMYWNPEEYNWIVFIDNGIRNIETLYADTVEMTHNFMRDSAIPSTAELDKLRQELADMPPDEGNAIALDNLHWAFDDWERHAIDVLGSHGYTLESTGDVTGIYETPDYGAPLDCWLRFDADETMDPEEYRAAVAAGEDVSSTAEANTYFDGDAYRVEWYLTSVGLVRTAYFSDYESATKFLSSNGFEDYTA